MSTSPITPNPFTKDECKHIVSEWQRLINREGETNTGLVVGVTALRRCDGVSQLNINKYLQKQSPYRRMVVLNTHAQYPNLSRERVENYVGCKDFIETFSSSFIDKDLQAVVKTLYDKHCNNL